MQTGRFISRLRSTHQALVLLSVLAWMLLGLPRAAAFACAARRAAVAAAYTRARASPALSAFTSVAAFSILRATGKCLVWDMKRNIYFHRRALP